MHFSLLPNNHYSLQMTGQVKEIISPMAAKLGIDHFCLVRYFDDKSCLILISNLELYQHHMSHEYPIAPIIPKKMLQDKFHYIIMPDLEDGFSQVAFEYREYFNLSCPLYLFERHKGYIDLYVMGAIGNGVKCVNTHINNLPQIEKFKSYFKESASDLISKSNENRIALPKHMQPNFGGLKVTEEPIKLTMGLSEETLRKHFSKRQTDVIYYLLRGYSAKETAISLGLSPRTIESYLDEIKEKMGVRKKSALIDKILSS